MGDLGLWNQSSQAQIINDLLNLLNLILNTIASPSQRVILQVQNLETSMQVINELADLERSCEVAESDGVGGEAAELFDKGDEGLEVLFDGDMEGIFELEVYWDCFACQ